MSQKNPSISQGVDWLMIWLYIALVAIGILSIFSVTYREGEECIGWFFKIKIGLRQTVFSFLLFLWLLVYYFIQPTVNFLLPRPISWYAFGIFLLLLVFPFHTEVKGTESIIRFGTFQIQPADICKIFVNLALRKIFIMG